LTQFKRSVSRKLNAGEIGQEVHTKIRYRKKSKKVVEVQLNWYEKIIAFFLKK